MDAVARTAERRMRMNEVKDCPCEHYCPAKNCEQCTEEYRAEILDDIAESLKRLCDVLFNAFVEACHNRRVVHLTKHHPKSRVRKKNLNRIMRVLKV